MLSDFRVTVSASQAVPSQTNLALFTKGQHMDHLSVAGIVATTPRHITTSEGLAITSFRLASNRRRFDPEVNRWVDLDTNWFTVVAFRRLAENAEKSIHKGDRVVVAGRVRVRDWQNDSSSGTAVEIEADALGHDLLWGTSDYSRNIAQAEETEEDPGA